MDGGCKWPPSLGASSTVAQLARFFARCNEDALHQALEEDGSTGRVAGRAVVSFSHFLPRPELHRTHPSKLGDRLGDVEGSLLLGEQVCGRSSLLSWVEAWVVA